MGHRELRSTTHAAGEEPAYEVDARGRRVAGPDPRRPGRDFVCVAAAVDILFVVAVFVVGSSAAAEGPGRLVLWALLGAAAWLVLAVRTIAMSPAALHLRRALGGVSVVVAVPWLLGVVGPEGRPIGALLPLSFLAVGVFGGVACHQALALLARETCEAHPSWADCTPPPAREVRRTVIISAGALAWVVCGGIESWRGNWWFGLVVAGGGVLGLVLARDLSRPSGDRHLKRMDRKRPRPWFLWPLAAPLLVLRAVWLLTHASSLP